MSLLNIVNSNRWELWPAQDIGFTGDYYIMENVLLHATTGPYLCLCQILSKHWKPFGSYGAHNNSTKKFVQGR